MKVERCEEDGRRKAEGWRQKKRLWVGRSDGEMEELERDGGGSGKV